MSLSLVLSVGVVLSIIFHFLGVYVGAKKIVWSVIFIMWAGTYSFAVHEIKPKGYDEVKKMQGLYEETDRLIKEAGDEISLYEFLTIKKSYFKNKKLAKKDAK